MKNFTFKKKFIASALSLCMVGGLSAQTPSTFEMTLQDPTDFAPFPWTHRTFPTFADYNGDGRMDIFYGGQMYNGDWSPGAFLMKQNEDGTFSLIDRDENGILGFSFGNAVFFDYDNDGYLDVIVQANADGQPDGLPFFQLFRNLGADNPDKFEHVYQEAFEFYQGDNETSKPDENGEGGGRSRVLRSITIGDLNKDGYLDIGFIGYDDYTENKTGRFVQTFINNGDGTFRADRPRVTHKLPVYEDGVLVENPDFFRPMSKGSIQFGDIDNDGWLDIVASGWTDGAPSGAEVPLDGGIRVAIYRNNHDGTYTEITPDNFEGACYDGDIRLGDFNNDGWLDILVGGESYVAGEWIWENMQLFLNNTDGTFDFRDMSTTKIDGAVEASIDLGDLNNDGFLDIVVTGRGVANGGRRSSIYYQDRNQVFHVDESYPLIPVDAGGLTIGDANGDNNLDIMVTGYSWTEEERPDAVATLMINTLADGTIKSNTPPTAPENLVVTYNDGEIKLTWDAASDDITPEETLLYNVYLKDDTADEVFMMIPAIIETGFVRSPTYIQTGTRLLEYTMYKNITEEELELGLFTVGVQAIDQSWAGGPFVSATIGNGTGIANDKVKSNIFVEVVEGGISVKADTNDVVVVRDMAGRTVAQGVTNTIVPLSENGVYLVTVAGKTYKVVK